MTAEQVPCHPILACARTLETELKSVSEMPADYLRTRDKEETLLVLAGVEAQATELRLRLLAAAGDVAEEHAARDAGTWLGHATRVTAQSARADLHLATDLEAHPLAAAAMRDGSVNQAQARVIIRSVDKLSDEVDDLTRARAEKHLIELAGTHDPCDLQVLGTKILEVVAPDIAEAELGKALEREEQAARDKCSLKMSRRGDGTTKITALVPDSIAERLTTYLDAEDAPRVTKSRSRGDAFCRLLEHVDPNRLPDHGGDATAVVVTIPFENLVNELGSAMLGSTVISASEARRLACT
ncbi:MAG TPA: DUF222 domain-containing protein, partial [Nocardioides sp.]|nr:DUF222 domain-containing protein [Nocardioides sp.]